MLGMASMTSSSIWWGTLLICCCSYIRLTHSSGHVFFAPGNEYRYLYEGETHMKDVATFTANAKIGIVPLSPVYNTSRQHCKLELHHYNLIINNGGEDQQPNLDELDFSKWMSFHIGADGEIESVFYEEEENVLILALKKVILSALSSKLVISQQSLSKQTRWAYEANETGHEGSYSSVYQAEPSGTNIIFTKTKTSKQLSSAHEEHSKVVHFRPTSHVPHKVLITDSFASPVQAQKGYVPSVAKTAEALHEGNNDLNFPAMSGNASVSMVLASIEVRADYIDETTNMPQNLVNSTLKVGEIPMPELSLRNASVQQDLASNISCIQQHDQQGLQHHTPCFQSMVRTLRRLPEEDLRRFFLDNVITSPNQPVNVRQIIVDAYGAAATNASWTVLTQLLLRQDEYKQAGAGDGGQGGKSDNHIYGEASADIQDRKTTQEEHSDDMIEIELDVGSSDRDELKRSHGAGTWKQTSKVKVDARQHWLNISAELTLRALVHFVGTDKIPPQILLETLEEKALNAQYRFPDPLITSQVNERALLVLGSLAQTMMPYKPQWAKNVIRQVETDLGSHDPYNHRELRAALTPHQLAVHVNRKAVRMLTMGNAVHASSMPYLRSYINDTDAHVLLKCAAVEAYGNYPHKEVAEELLMLALTDPEENVKMVSLNKYREHPYGGDVHAMMQAHKQYGNVTDVEHVRIRRDLKSVVKRIWQGFHWTLESPSMDWQKAIGGSKLGASFGLIIKNFVDINIKPLSGALVANIYDTAWATLHMGIIGLDLDIVRAELCFKGSIGYDLNILAEYGLQDVKAAAELYDKVVKKVFNNIKSIVDDFKGVMTGFKNFKPRDIFQDLVDSIEDMPDKILHLKQVARRVLQVLTEYTDMPPVVEKVTKVVKVVTKLFKDIKNDVMRFYESVVDAVSVTLPWAWKEIKTAFNAIGESVKHILKNPKGSIQAIGESISRISLAVTSVIDAKNKIQEANIFAKDNRPYWFDLPEILKAIWADIQDALQAAKDTVTWLQDSLDGKQNAKALDYTGSTMAEMRKGALLEIIAVVKDELAGPFEHIQKLLEPFLNAYNFFTGTVDKVKESWGLLVYGYKEARSQLDLIFGPRFHGTFPRKYLDSASCGAGFWESTGNGKYKYPGVDAQGENMQIGDEVVSPFAGELYVNNSQVVSIMVDGLQQVMLVMENVQALEEYADIPGQEVAAGRVIGTLVKPPHCADAHIHIALVKLTDQGIIDPSRYMERRKMPPPKWVQQCDHYLLKWLGKSVSAGSITGGPSTVDESPDIDDKWLSEEQEFELIDDEPLFSKRRRKRDLADTAELVLDKITNFTQSLGINVTKFKELFNIKISDIKVHQVLDVLDRIGLGFAKDGIMSLLRKIEEIANHEECVRPDSMDDDQLKAALIMRGKNPVGSSDTLIQRYLQTEPRCLGIQPRLSDNMYCRFDKDCLSMSCCVDIKFFIYRHAFVAYMSYDPCTRTLNIGLGEWSVSIDLTTQTLPLEESDPLVTEIQLLKIAQLVAYYRVKKEGENYKVRIGVTWCSVEKEICDDLVVLIEDATFPVEACDPNAAALVPIQTTLSDAPTVDKMLNMSITEVWKLADNMAGIDQETLKNITDDLRKAFEIWLEKKIESVLQQIFGDEFSLFDMCAKGFDLSFGPYKVVIYASPPIYFALGPIPCYFMFGVDGFYGASFQCTLCVLSMKAEATLVPQIGSSAWGELGVSLWCFRAGLKLTAYILTTSFPTKADIYFSKFPLDVRARMDLQLVPLRIELHAQLIFELSFKIWSKRITIRKVIFKTRLWFYQSKAINKNIFKIGDIEPDKTPPDFSFYSKATVKDEDDGGRRRRRAITSGTTNRCRVEQIANRDHTEPAYNIELDVNDDRSQVTMTYCVGTYPAGCDVIVDESLGGTSTTVVRNLVSGHKLWLTVTAKNSASSPNTATCELPTYDMTLPAGRVTPGFFYTSHPSIIQAAVFAIDDSTITQEKASVGYGSGSHGWQLVDWVDITTSKVTDTVDTGHDPLGLRTLEKFAPPRRGRLVHEAFRRATFSTPQACARICLNYPATRCQSFNYDYAATGGGACELHEAVEGQGINIHQSGAYSYFERIGIGRVSTLQYTELNLIHGSLVYVNVYLQNVLGYEQILSSAAVEVNLSPPSPGHIENATVDVLHVRDCASFTPQHLLQRCLVQTTLFNYRYIVDGRGSRCVFNGNSPLQDELYTRANRMIAANWDGFHDNVTGIVGYTWAVGTDTGETDVHPHRDPFSHLNDQSEWTHSASAYPLSLNDGAHYISVTALSNIDFGGPMAVSVHHATPYIVDTIPPVIYEIHSVTYNETSFHITANINATDHEGSGIARVEFGLGRSRRDTYLLSYVDVDNNDLIEYIHKLQDGVAAWPKARVTDYVDLQGSGHAFKPIVADSSPPIGGIVYDGAHKRKDWQYQSDTTQLCASWDGFYDTQSGIIVYQVGVGSESGLDDIASLLNVSHETTTYCFTGLSLLHAHTYYTMVRAWNGGHIEKDVTVVSDGVLIDNTAPEPGWVVDGEKDDIQYTSVAAAVAMNKGGFLDPESGHMQVKWNIYRTHAGPESSESLLHSEDISSSDLASHVLHHFHLRHGDHVTSEVNTTNNALLSTLARSDGFTVDLTDPEMIFVHDGSDPDNDQQYTARSDELSAIWEFIDVESDIDHYRLTAYNIQGSAQRQIFPTDSSASSWHELNDTSWSSSLDLTLGGKYIVQVAAVNGAGLTAVRKTNGVIVDTTPPQMSYTHAGVQPGESEELIDGLVLHNNPEGITASWAAIDTESGINNYQVAMGTTEGGYDVRAWQAFGTSQSGFLDGVNLELTDESTGFPVYYITVKATNGAGQISTPATSSAIKVVSGDQTGVVIDGSTEEDIDNQLQTHTITATFTGFQSALHGIIHHQVGVGSKPMYDDIYSFSDEGIISDDVDGIGSKGSVQLLLDLVPGMKYYVTVRAITGAGNALDAASDGVTVDTSAPQLQVISAGRPAAAAATLTRQQGVIYQRDTDNLPAEWMLTEEESQVTSLIATLGTVPGSSDGMQVILEPETLAIDTQLTPSAPGIANVITLTATNMVGLTNSSISSTVIVDQSPPQAGTVDCPQYITVDDGFSCTWTDFVDEESELDHYLFGVGHDPGDSALLDFTQLDHQQLQYTIQGIDVSHEDVLYATVIAVNKAGLRTQATSQRIVVDDTPPQGGWVIELADIDVLEHNIECPNGEVHCEEEDAVCQRSISQVITAWQAFTDTETHITRYEVGVGSLPGGTQLSTFQSVSVSSERRLVIRALDLSTVRTVYVTVKGYNAAGLYTSVTSNGVAVSRVSAGLSPIGPSLVYDGLNGPDLEFLESNEELSAHWDFSGDPCPIVHYKMSVHRVDGTVAVAAQDVPTGQTYGEVDELELHNGETYFFIISATNALGYTYSLYSDGVTVKLEPLLPGNVRDGNIFGMDLNFQPSVTSLSANWDGFGYDRNQQPGADYLPDASDIDSEIGRHQTVSHYEIAVGTDRRFPDTRNNVVPFINVLLNTSWTFEHLSLLPKTATYYVTVRAYGLNTAVIEITSNGIKVGYGGHIVKLGQVEIASWTPSVTSLSITWSDFEFLVPAKFYEIGITDDLTVLSDDCKDLKVETEGGELVSSGRSGQLFSIYSLQNVKLDTGLEITTLALKDGTKYQVVVMATDESGICSLATAITTVDVSPPTEGTLCVGPEYQMDVLYASERDHLHVRWSGYDDGESGIMRHEISLYQAHCSPSSSVIDDYTLLEEVEVVPADTQQFHYYGLQLQENVAYMVELRVINNAGSAVLTRSRPIVLDLHDPQAGDVHDGKFFTEDITYQSNTSSLSATLLYLPSDVGLACPYTEYPFTAGHNDWQPLVHGSVQALPNQRIRTLHFSKEQVSYSDIDGMTITLDRSVSAEKVKTGCVAASTQLLKTGSYKYDIKTSGSSKLSIASVTFWDGPYGLPAALNLPDLFAESVAAEIDGYGQVGEGMEALPDPVDDDTYMETFDDDFTDSMGFGFLLAPGMSHDGILSDWLVLWAAHRGRTRINYFDLGLHFTEEWHTYQLDTRFEDESTDITLDSSSLSVYVDGKLRNYLSGTPYLHGNVQALLLAYTYRGYVPPITDIFNPPTASVSFRQVRFPPAVSLSCRYGSPFRAGDRAIVEFMAAVGTTPQTTDIRNFTKVLSPCVPCQEACGIDASFCDAACDADTIQEHSFSVDGLSLDPLYHDDNLDDNATALPAPYFIIVKAVTGSGRSVVSSDNGIYIDPSPPRINSIFHIDVEWNDEEPSDYQGNDHSIAAITEVQDDESKISGCEWAIGSTIEGTDLQDYIAMEELDFVINTQLKGKLLNAHTYYVTLRCTNTAGLTQTQSSDGVTVLLDEPDVSDTGTALEGTEALGDEAVKQEEQDRVKVVWDEPTDSTVDSIYFSVGSNESSSDVFPERQVGYNSSGKMEISGDGLTLDEDDPSGARANLSAARDRTKRQAPESQFFMEPGRALYVHVKACSKAHKCAQIPVKPLFIARKQDQVATRSPDDQLQLHLGGNVIIQTKQGEDSACSLIGGILSTDDLTAHYHSDASNHFKPSITDPVSTTDKTDRNLRHRIKSTSDVSFFLSSSCKMSRAVEVSVPFHAGDYEAGKIEPRLITWCALSEQWVDVARSCSDTPLYSINWLTETFTVQLCDVSSLCSTDTSVGSSRRKRAVATGPSSGQSMFTLAAADTVFSNSRPVVTSPDTANMFEDDGIRRIQLTAMDPDGDEFVFRLNITGLMGNVTLTADGVLIYRPCKNCEGIESIHFSVIEKRTDGEEALITNSMLTFTVNGVNDEPRMLIIKNGKDGSGAEHKAMFTVEEHTEYASNDRHIILMAYDPDQQDNLTLHFDNPSHGNLSFSSFIKQVTFLDSDCASIADMNWDKIAREIKRHADSFPMPRPCGLKSEAYERDITWILTVVTYTPQQNYYGKDMFKVLSIDASGSPSEVSSIEMYVLHNPCQNGAVCTGPDHDTDCTGTSRVYGFADYNCSCVTGYAGRYCEADYDDCLSDPCPNNMSCIDAHNNYTCVCLDGAVCDDGDNTEEVLDERRPFMKTWQYAVLSVGLLIPIIIVAAVLTYCCREHHKLNDNKLKKGKGLDTASRIALFNNRFGERTPYQYANPVYHGDQIVPTRGALARPAGDMYRPWDEDRQRPMDRAESRERAYRVHSARKNTITPSTEAALDLAVLRALEFPEHSPRPSPRYFVHDWEEDYDSDGTVWRGTRRRRTASVGSIQEVIHHPPPDYHVSDHRVLDHRLADHRVSDRRVSDHRVSDLSGVAFVQRGPSDRSWSPPQHDDDLLIIPADSRNERPKQLPRVRDAWRNPKKLRRVVPAPDYPGAETLWGPGYRQPSHHN